MTRLQSYHSFLRSSINLKKFFLWSEDHEINYTFPFQLSMSLGRLESEREMLTDRRQEEGCSGDCYHQPFTVIFFPDGDADSGVDESTQAEQTTDPSEPARRPTTSRIPRKTPPDSPLKKVSRARSTAPPEKRRVPRSKSVPKVPFAFSAAPPVESIKKGF